MQGFISANGISRQSTMHSNVKFLRLIRLSVFVWKVNKILQFPESFYWFFPIIPLDLVLIYLV